MARKLEKMQKKNPVGWNSEDKRWNGNIREGSREGKTSSISSKVLFSNDIEYRLKPRQFCTKNNTLLNLSYWSSVIKEQLDIYVKNLWIFVSDICVKNLWNYVSDYNVQNLCNWVSDICDKNLCNWTFVFQNCVLQRLK